MVRNLTQGPDPRFGMQVPLISNLTMTASGGLASNLTISRSVTLADPNNPFTLAT